MRHFLSGGSSGPPRLLATEEAAWQARIADTASVLQKLGVVEGSSVVIAHPSFPWSVGVDFADAVARIGASPICLGSEAFSASVVEAWLQLKPGFICSPPVLLAKLPRYLAGRTHLRAIVAGQLLELHEERHVLDLGVVSDIRRVYGNAELGTLGFQAGSDPSNYRLNPRFTYSLKSDGGFDRLIVHNGDVALVTPDVGILTVNHQSTMCPRDNWGDCEFRLVGRIDEHVKLQDGSILTAALLRSVEAKCRLAGSQLVVSGRSLEYLIATEETSPIGDPLSELLALSPDLRSSVAEGELEISMRYITLGQLKVNARGKRLAFFVGA